MLVVQAVYVSLCRVLRWLCRLYVDPALDSLLHLHERSKWTAPNGAPGDPIRGSNRPKYASCSGLLGRTSRHVQIVSLHSGTSLECDALSADTLLVVD